MVDIPDREAVVLVDEYGVPYKAGGAASGGTSATDNDAFTVDSGSGTPAMGYVGNDAVTAGNVGVLGMLGNRQLKVTVYDSNGDEVTFGGDGGGGGEVTGNVADNAADSGNPVKVGAKYNATVPTYDDGDRADLQVGSRGSLRVQLQANNSTTNLAGSMSSDGVHENTIGVFGTAMLYGFDGTNSWNRMRGDTTNGLDVDVTRSALPSGASTSANQTTIIGHLDGVEGLLTTIDADTGGILTAVQLLDNAISGNEMQVDVVASLPAGTNNIGDVDVASIAAGTNLIGDVGIRGRATGGLSPFRSIDLDETEEDVKTSAGTVYAIHAINLTDAPLFLKLYNATAANTTVGTTTPLLTLPIPGNGDSDGAGFTFAVAQGIAFSTAICAAVTTGVADNDTGAPGANAAIVNIFYA